MFSFLCALAFRYTRNILVPINKASLTFHLVVCLTKPRRTAHQDTYTDDGGLAPSTSCLREPLPAFQQAYVWIKMWGEMGMRKIQEILKKRTINVFRCRLMA